MACTCTCATHGTSNGGDNDSTKKFKRVARETSLWHPKHELMCSSPHQPLIPNNSLSRFNIDIHFNPSFILQISNSSVLPMLPMLPSKFTRHSGLLYQHWPSTTSQHRQHRQHRQNRQHRKILYPMPYALCPIPYAQSHTQFITGIDLQIHQNQEWNTPNQNRKKFTQNSLQVIYHS